MTFKPMLAATADNDHLEQLRFPAMVSPKLDGVRATVLNGQLMSRKLKPIPNVHTQFMFGHRGLEGLDGELIVGKPTDKDCFLNTSGAVRRMDGTPKATFWVFDRVPPMEFAAEHFRERLKAARRVCEGSVKLVPHVLVKSLEALLAYETKCLEQGYEGVMLRDPAGAYKFGRSTLREGGLIKLKRFMDSEAVVLGLEEQMHNGNEATIGELGQTKRSSHKANLSGKGTLGALLVRDAKTGVEFSIGTGFDDAMRAKIWAQHHAHIFEHSAKVVVGRLVKYKFFPTGTKEKPRFPTFLGWRDEWDM